MLGLSQGWGPPLICTLSPFPFPTKTLWPSFTVASLFKIQLSKYHVVDSWTQGIREVIIHWFLLFIRVSWGIFLKYIFWPPQNHSGSLGPCVDTKPAFCKGLLGLPMISLVSKPLTEPGSQGNTPLQITSGRCLCRPHWDSSSHRAHTAFHKWPELKQSLLTVTWKAFPPQNFHPMGLSYAF